MRRVKNKREREKEKVREKKRRGRERDPTGCIWSLWSDINQFKLAKPFS